MGKKYQLDELGIILIVLFSVIFGMLAIMGIMAIVP